MEICANYHGKRGRMKRKLSKQDNEIDLARASMQRVITQRYGHKTSYPIIPLIIPLIIVGIFMGLLLFIMFLFLATLYLISHPISLAILCSTVVAILTMSLIWRLAR